MGIEPMTSSPAWYLLNHWAKEVLFAISEIKIVQAEKASEISNFDKFEKAMALYQKLQRSDAKTVYALVESYE